MGSGRGCCCCSQVSSPGRSGGGAASWRLKCGRASSPPPPPRGRWLGQRASPRAPSSSSPDGAEYVVGGRAWASSLGHLARTSCLCSPPAHLVRASGPYCSSTLAVHPLTPAPMSPGSTTHSLAAKPLSPYSGGTADGTASVVVGGTAAGSRAPLLLLAARPHPCLGRLPGPHSVPLGRPAWQAPRLASAGNTPSPAAALCRPPRFTGSGAAAAAAAAVKEVVDSTSSRCLPRCADAPLCCRCRRCSCCSRLSKTGRRLAARRRGASESLPLLLLLPLRIASSSLPPGEGPEGLPLLPLFGLSPPSHPLPLVEMAITSSQSPSPGGPGATTCATDAAAARGGADEAPTGRWILSVPSSRALTALGFRGLAAAAAAAAAAGRDQAVRGGLGGGCRAQTLAVWRGAGTAKPTSPRGGLPQQGAPAALAAGAAPTQCMRAGGQVASAGPTAVCTPALAAPPQRVWVGSGCSQHTRLLDKHRNTNFLPIPPSISPQTSPSRAEIKRVRRKDVFQAHEERPPSGTQACSARHAPP